MKLIYPTKVKVKHRIINTKQFLKFGGVTGNLYIHPDKKDFMSFKFNGDPKCCIKNPTNPREYRGGPLVPGYEDKWGDEDIKE